MRAEYINPEVLEHLCFLLQKENSLAIRVSMFTGLRISDVLALKTSELARTFSVREQKTAKKRKVYLSEELLQECLSISGRVYVFEHRTDWTRSRTRQAVFKDLKRVAMLCRRQIKSINIAPHSARKVYAVAKFAKFGNIKKVQELLNHDREAVTVLYALADKL